VPTFYGMSTAPKVIIARAVPWEVEHNITGVEVQFEGGRRVAFPVGSKTEARHQAALAKGSAVAAEAVWRKAQST
jgi:hypothetical protein